MSATDPNSFSSPYQAPPPLHPQAPLSLRSEGSMQLPPMASLLRHDPHPGLEERVSYPPQPAHSQFTGYTHPLQLSEMNPSAPLHHIYHPAQPSQYSAHPTRQTEPQLVPIQPQQMLRDPVQYSGPPAPRRQSKKIGQRRADLPKDHVQVNRSSESLEGRYNEPVNGIRSPEQDRHSPRREPSSAAMKDEIYPQESQTRSVPISGLLSSTSVLDRPRPTYNLTIRQQPHSARACGYGERDRRVVDPPPILILDIDNPADGTMVYVVHCVLWNADSDTDATTMPESTERKQQRRLMGNNVTNAFPGKDENNEDKLFFPFADISVRTPGTYRLKFSLCELDMSNFGRRSKCQIVATAMSKPFQVFNAKDFGGMQASSALTKSLKAQGCLIPVKKGNSKTNASHMRDEDDDDGYNDDDLSDDERPSGGPKRPKHR